MKRATNYRNCFYACEGAATWLLQHAFRELGIIATNRENA